MRLVLLFGYNVLAPNWEQVFWGIPDKSLMGRGPLALLTAVKEKANYLLFGAGIPVKNGKPESEIERDYLCRALPDFFLWPDVRSSSIVGWEVTDLLEGAMMDTRSQNSREIAIWASGILREKEASVLERHKIIAVSDCNNLSRCMNDIACVFKDEFGRRVRISGEMSAVPYAGGPGDCLVLEPPLIEAIGRARIEGLLTEGKAQMNNPAKLQGEEGDEE